VSSGLVVGRSSRLGRVVSTSLCSSCRPCVRRVVSFPAVVVWSCWRSSASVTWHLRPVRFVVVSECGWVGSGGLPRYLADGGDGGGLGFVLCAPSSRRPAFVVSSGPSSCCPGLRHVVRVFVVSFAPSSLGGVGHWDPLALVNLGDVAPATCPVCGCQ
jgi:hypothetical protein